MTNGSPRIDSGAVQVGRERLLSLADICDMTGWCPVTASRFLDESGRKLKIHGRVFILESSFFAYLHELEEANDE